MYHSRMDQKLSHGGARRNAGRRAERTDLDYRKRTLTLDDMTMRKLAVLGGGNASRGARLAADAAFDLLQRGKIQPAK